MAPGPRQREGASRAARGRIAKRWLGRLAALCLLLSTPALSFVERIDSTLLEPDFYTAHLERAGAFRVLAEDFVPRVAEKRLREQFPEISTAAVDEMRELLAQILSRAYFRAQTREFAVAWVAWAAGDEQRLAVKIPVAERINAAAEAVETRLPSSAIATRIYRWALERAVDELVLRATRLPFGIPVERDLWLAALRTAVPRTWVVQSSIGKLPLLASFLTGERDALDFVIPLYERQSATANALRFLVERSNSLDFLREQVLKPAIRESVEPFVLIPEAGLTLDQDELAEAFDSALTTLWVRERQLDIVDSVLKYLVGKQELLELVVPLRPLKHAATVQLEARVVAKLEQYYAELPVCTQSELSVRFFGQQQGPWRCRPMGLGFDFVRAFSGLDLRSKIRKRLDARIPDTWTYSEQRSREAIGDAVWQKLELARHWMKHGYPLRLDELRVFLRRGQEDVLEQVLGITRQGWSFEEGEIREGLRRWVDDDAEHLLDRVSALTRSCVRLRPWLWLLLFASVLTLLQLHGYRQRFLVIGRTLLWGALLGMAGVALSEASLAIPTAAECADDASLTAIQSLSAMGPGVLREMAGDFFATWQLRNLELFLLGGVLYGVGRARRALDGRGRGMMSCLGLEQDWERGR